MPTDMFLKLEGVEGETEDSKHSNEIEVLTFSFSATQQGTFASGGGGGAGKVAFGDLHIHKRVDKASANLFKKCATGDHIKSAVLTVRKAGKEQQEYYKIKLTDLLVSSVVNNGSEHHGSVV